MTVPKINSSHGSDTRNVLNRAIDSINVQGKSIQNLVAKGQLTPTQYAELLREVNSLIAKGEVKLDDLDPETLEAINNGSGTPFEILSIPRDRSVTTGKTTFFDFSKNLFDLEAATYGYYIEPNENGILKALDGYVTSDYIPVNNGQNIHFNMVFTVSFFDADKNHLSGFRNSPASAKYYTAPADGYVRYSFHRNNLAYDKAQAEYGTVGTDYVKFASIKEGYLPKIEVGQNELLDKSVTPEKTSFFEFGKNLFDPGSALLNHYLRYDADGLTSFSGYITSDYIPVEKDQNIHLNMVFSIAFYDVNKVYISSERNSPQSAKYYTAPADGFIRYSFHKDFMNINSAQAEYGTTETAYEQFASLKKSYLPAIESDGNKIKGKRLLNFGDSIASAATAGVEGYHEILRDKYGMVLTSHANGGAKVTVHPGETNHIKAQIDAAITANNQADYILFCGLRNDVGDSNATIGEITSGYDDVLDLSTFCGAFEHYCKTLRENWLHAKIVYVRTHNTSAVGMKQKTLGDLAVEMCEKWSVHVVDTYKYSGLNTNISSMRGVYTIGEADGTHPNTAGYETFYVPMIVNKLTSI